ncbi:fibropellin-3-like [Dreissena polymorpha]|uniref:fibropellin-3-like n=1 Tax=Dreissena polymorpha TaxID=45954 RepID=UPI0022641176|nr:fibropellin-3-like [Dreissena polymorpha]
MAPRAATFRMRTRANINECAPAPCKNGATCTNLQNAYSCTCSPGWQGNNCEHDINECAPAPCKNGATCSNLQNAYSCKCVPGWHGKNCDQDINECAPAPCKNGATCTNLQNAYSCTCSPGWQGNNCEHDINECAPAPCKNGATCSNLQNAYSCKCVAGWHGENCDQDINECAPASCKNGATCTNLQNAYSCTCSPGWQGNNCDHGSAPEWKKIFQTQRTAKVNDNTKLFCRVKGKPRPSIEWFKNGEALADGNRVRITKYALEVMNTQLSDAGEYACRASNQHGALWGNMTLRVLNEMERLPLPPIVDEKENQTAIQGDNVRFTCKIMRSDSQYFLLWFHYYKVNDSFVNEKGKPMFKLLQVGDQRMCQYYYLLVTISVILFKVACLTI